MSEEVWKQYDNYVEVSNTGKVRSISTKYEYKPQGNGHGYLSVNILYRKDGLIY